jgi:glutamine synthetase
MRFLFEYVWTDVDGKFRSKTKVINNPDSDENNHEVFMQPSPASLPVWNFDGSSCGLASGDNSDVLIKPQAVFRDPFRDHTIYSRSFLVLCDCYDSNFNPLETNTRYRAQHIFEQTKEQQPMYGLEQEYVIYDCDTKRPIGWDVDKDPEPQGPYYCGIGSKSSYGRHLAERHLQYCLEAGVNLSGINAEVMPGQWEFQVGPCVGIDSGDHMMMARYILERLSEEHMLYISYDPKPEEGDWNGSGCHMNFSTSDMRNDSKYIYEYIKKLEPLHNDMLKYYGNNQKRLTGEHETSDPTKFTYGVADRTASIRIPLGVHLDGKGYLEDRRPASDCDPYIVTSMLAQLLVK